MRVAQENPERASGISASDKFADIGTPRGTFVFLLALIPARAHFSAAALSQGRVFNFRGKS
jgi:hypothetical protein